MYSLDTSWPYRSHSLLPPVSSSKHTTKGGQKAQGATYLWERTHFRCLPQPEFPLCYVLPKSASCLLDLLHWCFTLAALVDFPGGSLLNAWTLRADVSPTLIRKPVKDITRKKLCKTMYLRNVDAKILKNILGNWIQQHRERIIHHDQVELIRGI